MGRPVLQQGAAVLPDPLRRTPGARPGGRRAPVGAPGTAAGAGAPRGPRGSGTPSGRPAGWPRSSRACRWRAPSASRARPSCCPPWRFGPGAASGWTGCARSGARGRPAERGGRRGRRGRAGRGRPARGRAAWRSWRGPGWRRASGRTWCAVVTRDAAIVALAGGRRAACSPSRCGAGGSGPGPAVALVVALAVADLARAGAGLNPPGHRSRSSTRCRRFGAAASTPSGRTRVFSYGLDHSPAFREFLCRGGPRAHPRRDLFLPADPGPYTNVLDRVEAPEATDLTAFAPRARELGPEVYDPGAVGRLLPWLRNAAVSRVLSLDPLSHPDLVPLGHGRPRPAGARPARLPRADPWPRAYVACRTAGTGAEPLMAPYRAGLRPGARRGPRPRHPALPPPAPTCGAGVARRAAFVRRSGALRGRDRRRPATW